MDLLLEAAKAWDSLQSVRYIFDVAKRGKLKRIELSFAYGDFPHLAGMQYAEDVDFGIRKSEYYGQLLIPALLSGRMDGSKITAGRNWGRISGRLVAIKNLQNTLDNKFIIVSFNKRRVKGYSQLNAEFAIKSTVSDDVYFVFLDERSGRYYCKSAFRKESIDYTENQSRLTLLQETKIMDGTPIILFTKEGYSPEDESAALSVS